MLRNHWGGCSLQTLDMKHRCMKKKAHLTPVTCWRIKDASVENKRRSWHAREIPVPPFLMM